ncbi:hypothetical protein HDU98_008457 [Podochytrium sp. JEL0797]|nr:hypothetical protein HDU98_008457 [Podochytrium sp. JEL0797]
MSRQNPNVFPNGSYPTIPGQICTGACCLPCPTLFIMYPTDSLDFQGIVTSVINLCSLLGSAFVCVSYLVFPKKRTHPAKMVMYASLMTAGFHVAFAINVGNPARYTCIDDITSANQFNSGVCTAQATVVLYTLLTTILWIALFVVSLHLRIVWRNSFLDDKYVYFQIIWVLGAIPVAIFAGLQQLAASGEMCLFAPQYAHNVYLLPVAVVGFPALLAHGGTLLYIAKVAVLGIAAEMARKSVATQVSNNTNGKGDGKSVAVLPASMASLPGAAVQGNQAAAALAKKGLDWKKTKEILKEQVELYWRSVLLAIVYCSWIVYIWIFLDSLMTAQMNQKNDEWAQKWYGCALSGNSQTQCAQYMVGHIPSVNQVTVANLSMASAGMIFFLIFGTGMMKEWKGLIFN